MSVPVRLLPGSEMLLMRLNTTTGLDVGVAVSSAGPRGTGDCVGRIVVGNFVGRRVGVDVRMEGDILGTFEGA